MKLLGPGKPPSPEPALDVLEPWRSFLRDMAPDLARLLVPWIRGLERRLGPFGRSITDEQGEPDGYADLSRRGPYERLLTTEWALAQAAPLEFQRRAAMGEHLFLDLERRRPRGDGRIVALFDGGADQLGRPRIAQMAAWVALAARAERVGAELWWGDVLDPETELLPTDLGLGSAAGFETFLARRSLSVPDRSHLEAWRDRLAADCKDPGRVEEHWWIGGETLAELGPCRAAGPASRRLLTLRQESQWETDSGSSPGETAEQRRPGLEVRLSGDVPATTFRLGALPAAAEIRLLRHPCRPVALGEAALETGARGSSVDGPTRFADLGRRLVSMDAESQLVAFHVPDHSKQQPGRPRYLGLPDRASWVAAGFTKRRWHAVVRFEVGNVQTESIAVRGFKGRAVQRHVMWTRLEQSHTNDPPTLPVPAPPGALLGPCFADVGYGSGAAWWLDGTGGLWVADLDRLTYERVSRKASALQRSRAGLFAVVHDGERHGFPPHSLVRMPQKVGPESSSPVDRIVFFPLSSDPVHKVFLGHAPTSSRFRNAAGLVSAFQGDDAWHLQLGSRKSQLHPGSDARVVGVAVDGDGEPGLLLVEADGRTLQLVSRRRVHLLLRADGPIRHVEASTARPKVAVHVESPHPAGGPTGRLRTYVVMIPSGELLRLTASGPADEERLELES